MTSRFIYFAAAALLAAPLLTVPAFSAGDGGGTVDCPKGQVLDKKTSKCVPAARGMTDDDSLYETGRNLALAGRYDEAIQVLTLAADKSDPRILNYLGYAHRKSGRVLVGLGYYEEALRQDPDYTLVREYMGEAQLQIGDVAAAREQLSEIEKRCGTGCREYTLLSRQIDDYLKG